MESDPNLLGVMAQLVQNQAQLVGRLAAVEAKLAAVRRALEDLRREFDRRAERDEEEELGRLIDRGPDEGGRDACNS